MEGCGPGGVAAVRRYRFAVIKTKQTAIIENIILIIAYPQYFLGSNERHEEQQDDYLDDPTDDANPNGSERALVIQSLSNGDDHGSQHPYA